MKLKTFLSLGVAMAGLTLSTVAATPKLVVAILVDQLRYDYLERFHDQFGEGGFKLLTDQGAFMTSAKYNYYPTITAPGHATFFSGSPPAVTGIIGNEWFDKKTRKQMYCVEDKSVQGVGTTNETGQMSPRNFIGDTFADEMRLRYHSKVVGISMKDRGAVLPAGKKPIGAFWFESKSGNFVSSTYYAPELPAWVKAFNDRKRAGEFVGQTWDRLLDASKYEWDDTGAGEGSLTGEKGTTFPHKIAPSKAEGFETIMPTPFGNQLLLELAMAAVEGEKLGEGKQPDVLCVSFSSIDYVGHKFGPNSHEMQDTVLRLDKQLAEFFAFLDKKVGLANVAMVLTADHGVMPNPEFASAQGMDGERVKESELVVDLMSKLSAQFGDGKYLLSPKSSNGQLFLNYDTLREKKLNVNEVCGFIREWALATGKYQACYTRDQMLEGRAPGLVGQMVLNGYNPERSGDVVLIMKPYAMPAGTGANAKTGTTHGSPYAYDARIPVIFYGPLFKPGRYGDEFAITDIAPTLAAALRTTTPAGCIGKAFIKALAETK